MQNSSVIRWAPHVSWVSTPYLLADKNRKQTLNIEVRDSRTGYLIPARYGMGVWPDGKIVGKPSSSASPGNHLEKVTLTVLVFGPESISYERSRRETGARINHFSARVFFVKIPQSQNSMIYTILNFFRIHIPKMDSFPMLFSHPTRPPVRPSARHGSKLMITINRYLFAGLKLMITINRYLFAFLKLII